ncbi:MAG: hypothetical protein ACJ0DF_13585 [Paracoccaceae bacterium]
MAIKIKKTVGWIIIIFFSVATLAALLPGNFNVNKVPALLIQIIFVYLAYRYLVNAKGK